MREGVRGREGEEEREGERLREQSMPFVSLNICHIALERERGRERVI